MVDARCFVRCLLAYIYLFSFFRHGAGGPAEYDMVHLI